MTALPDYVEVRAAQNCCSTKKQIRRISAVGLLPACVVWEMSQLQRSTGGTRQEHEGEAEEAEDLITGN